MNDIGIRIREIRKKKKLTQTQLAEIIGVQASAISKYEKGIVSPTIEQIKKIADALEVTVYEFMGDIQKLPLRQIDIIANMNGTNVVDFMGEENFKNKLDEQEFDKLYIPLLLKLENTGRNIDAETLGRYFQLKEMRRKEVHSYVKFQLEEQRKESNIDVSDTNNNDSE